VEVNPAFFEQIIVIGALLAGFSFAIVTQLVTSEPKTGSRDVTPFLIGLFSFSAALFFLALLMSCLVTVFLGAWDWTVRAGSERVLGGAGVIMWTASGIGVAVFMVGGAMAGKRYSPKAFTYTKAIMVVAAVIMSGLIITVVAIAPGIAP